MRWLQTVPLLDGSVISAMSFRIGVAALLLVFVTACRPSVPMSDPKLGVGVREALARGDEVNVMVALVTEGGASGQAASATAAIAKAQDAVLWRLDSADFRLRQRYAAVPAFSGTLRSTRGLDRLLAHPLVRRVDRDPGGTGLLSR